MGQGIPPDNGTTVYVTAGLDRLIDVDDQNYRFEAVLFVLLTWSDPRAMSTMLASTAQSAPGSNTTCVLPCTSLFVYEQDSPCCDGVWLPHLELVNVRGESQDRIVRYGIQFAPALAVVEGIPPRDPNGVSFWAHVQAEFYTNLNFMAFPFDQQKLVIQFAFGTRHPERPVSFVQSSTALSMYFPRSGDDISGWNIKNITLDFYNNSAQVIYDKSTFIYLARYMVLVVCALTHSLTHLSHVSTHTKNAVTPSNPNDPVPVHPPFNTDFRFISYLWTTGFTIIIDVSRISLYFILMAVLPVILNVWLALLVFSISPKHLDTRLGIIVTLFLSLTALMLVVANSLPQSSYIVPTQQLCLLSYCVLGFVGLESIIIYKFVTVERQLKIKKLTKQAKKQFTKRWETARRSRSVHVASQRQKSKAPFSSCCAPWPSSLRFRKAQTNANGEATSMGPEEMMTATTILQSEDSLTISVSIPEDEEMTMPRSATGLVSFRPGSVTATAPMPKPIIKSATSLQENSTIPMTGTLTSDNRRVSIMDPREMSVTMTGNGMKDSLPSSSSTQSQLPLPPSSSRDIPSAMMRKRSTVEGFVPMGGFAGNSDDDDSGGAPSADFGSQPSDFASSDDDSVGVGARSNSGGGAGGSSRKEGTGAKNKLSKLQQKLHNSWMGNNVSKGRAAWAESRVNPDYALYIALKADRWVFWFTVVVYDVLVVVLLAVNSSYTAPLQF